MSQEMKEWLDGLRSRRKVKIFPAPGTLKIIYLQNGTWGFCKGWGNLLFCFGPPRSLDGPVSKCKSSGPADLRTIDMKVELIRLLDRSPRYQSFLFGILLALIYAGALENPNRYSLKWTVIWPVRFYHGSFYYRIAQDLVNSGYPTCSNHSDWWEIFYTQPKTGAEGHKNGFLFPGN